MNGASTIRPRSFPHGVHPPEHKYVSARKPVRRIPFPPRLVVPMSQHLGAPARPIVREEQEVVRGEPIAEPGGFVSVPMHAPLTGTVEKVDLALLANGNMGPAVYLKPYPGSSQEVLYGYPQDPEILLRDELAGAVQDTGMVGLGGAAFPTHVKMKPPEGKVVDTVIANGCECEPYLTSDHRVMLERADDVFTGLAIALRATGAGAALIGIETNKPDAIDSLRESIPEDMPVEVVPVETKYPQGAEKMLIKALTGREVPSGGLPHDAGVCVFNVATLAMLGRLLPRGQGLIERIVTVTGPGVQRPGNYLIPFGATLRHVFAHVGLEPDARQIILGGPMMGQSVSSLDVPVTKGVGGILVFTDTELEELPRKEYPCIRCGQCLQACPAMLNPSRMGLLARNGGYEIMEKQFHLNDCFECGCCAYTCPSNIPLVHLFRVAKAANRRSNSGK